jgi:hypothetical protein
VNRILIMVLSYNESPYKELMEAQQNTFDSVSVEGVDTLYYHGIGQGEMPPEHRGRGYINKPIHQKYSNVLLCACTDSYYFMSEKFKLALEYARFGDYDYIFRTNSSSYINKQRLKEFAETLPKEKLYAGWTFTDSEDFGGACVSGAGIWLSRDTAEILRKEIDPEFEMEEDVYCGRILRKHGIKAIDDKSRIDNICGLQLLLAPTLQEYHLRFKTEDRYKDAENMRMIHKHITE